MMRGSSNYQIVQSPAHILNTQTLIDPMNLGWSVVHDLLHDIFGCPGANQSCDDGDSRAMEGDPFWWSPIFLKNLHHSLEGNRGSSQVMESPFFWRFWRRGRSLGWIGQKVSISLCFEKDSLGFEINARKGNRCFSQATPLVNGDLKAGWHPFWHFQFKELCAYEGDILNGQFGFFRGLEFFDSKRWGGVQVDEPAFNGILAD